MTLKREMDELAQRGREMLVDSNKVLAQTNAVLGAWYNKPK